MSYERKTPVLLVCCGSLNPVTVAHLKMFEIARDFLERMGSHFVIGGILSPVHDAYKKPGLLPSKHRVQMCRLAVKRYPWLSVDPWESEQPEWVETIRVLRHQADVLKQTYGAENWVLRSGSCSPYSPTETAVTLQPGMNNYTHIPKLHPIRSSASGQGSASSFFVGHQRYATHPSPYDSVDGAGSLELNEASEPSLHDKTGIVFDKLSQNLKRMCCARPTAFGTHHSNMIYGASCDIRKTKVMLLCGGDLLESFVTPGVWKEEDIREMVTKFGIVCIPRQQVDDESDRSLPAIELIKQRERRDKLTRKALEKLQDITKNTSGTVILVNDTKNPDINHISSTKCRQAIRSGLTVTESLLVPSVLNYIQQNNLYTEVAA